MAKCKKGFKKVKGKCRKTKSVGKSSSKKSNNPFKMWGSYVGMILIIPLTGFIFSGDVTLGTFIDKLMSESLSTVFMLLIVGFLVGWAIQLLIRRFKK